MNSTLVFDHISKAFPGVQALDDVSIVANAGEVLVLQGENGAGKSTLLKILSGLHKADSGTIFFKGKEISFKHTYEATKAGIAMVYQELTLLPLLSVAQNVFMNYEHRTPNGISKTGLINDKELNKRFTEIANNYDVNIDPRELVGDLSITEQQMVEIIKALAKDPEVLILDEPTSALTKSEVDSLYNIVTKLKSEGKVIIFISHRMDDVFRFGDRIAVLKDGKHIKTVKAGDVTEKDLIKMMVGREIQDVFPEKKKSLDKDVIFEVKNLTLDKDLRDVSFDVRQGEIFGIAGLQGQGQTEILRALAGVKKLKSGEISINGKKVNFANPRQAISKGIVYVPEDRKVQGLFLTLPIRENIAASSLSKRQTAGFVKKKKENQVVAESIKKFGIKTPSAEQYAVNLSGGNQQKVVLGRCCAANPKVLLFNEPTRGIDVDSKQEIYRLMREYADNGIAVIMYSSDMLELIGLCDKIITIYEGRVTKLLKSDELTEENVLCGISGITRN